VRLEREAQARALSEQRAIEASETRAKAELVRYAGDAAARSRARSEGAKHEAAKSMVRDRMAREEEQRQFKQAEIDKMEREEAALITRLQHTQERHKAAFMQLEDALRSDVPMLTNGLRSGSGTPLASHRGVPASLVSERSRNAQLGVGTSSNAAGGARPPRPRAAATSSTPSSSSAAHSRLPPRPSEPGPRPESASRRVVANGKPVPSFGKGPGGDHSSRALSSCSTSAGESSGGGPCASLLSLPSGPSTPSSGAQAAPISYTTCDGAQIEIPAEEELDLNSLLNC